MTRLQTNKHADRLRDGETYTAYRRRGIDRRKERREERRGYETWIEMENVDIVKQF